MASSDDWHTVALFALFALAGTALIVFAWHELRRSGSRLA
jgi:hypothetical protein